VSRRRRVGPFLGGAGGIINLVDVFAASSLARGGAGGRLAFRPASLYHPSSDAAGGGFRNG